MPIRKKTGKIPWVYYRSRRGTTNRPGKNKGDLGVGNAEYKKRGTRLFRVRELLQNLY